MNDDRAAQADTAIRYERSAPTSSCSKCQRPLWAGDVSRIAWVEKADAWGKVAPRLIRECVDCNRVPPAVWA